MIKKNAFILNFMIITILSMVTYTFAFDHHNNPINFAYEFFEEVEAQKSLKFDDQETEDLEQYDINNSHSISYKLTHKIIVRLFSNNYLYNKVFLNTYHGREPPELALS